MEKQKIIDTSEETFYKVYNRYPVVFDHGSGVRLYDTDGEEYLDFAAGIAVMALGYDYPGYRDALKAQIDKICHTSNFFYNEPALEAGQKLLAASGMERVFFTNSGTEAVEGALKIARRYAYNKYQGRSDQGEQAPSARKDLSQSPAAGIIAMNDSFHGRSLGALSVTGSEHYRTPFEPLIPGVKFAGFNDLASVEALFDENTCAIILEPIQGEGGVHVATKEFLQGVRELCDKYDALLIFDEIQCGMGRSGSMFAWQDYGVKPDVMTVAKALGNGVPIGAFLAAGKAARAMVPGDHGSTYGGNPLVCAAAAKVLDIFEQDDIAGRAKEMGTYLWEALDGLMAEFPALIVEHRGRGLIQGLEFSAPVAPIINNALLEQKLVIIPAGANVIRFVPPLVIERSDVDEMCAKLRRAIDSTVR